MNRLFQAKNNDHPIKSTPSVGSGRRGTDVSPYTDLYGGSVLNATIDKYIYASLEQLNEPAVIVESYDLGESYHYGLMPTLPIDGQLDLLKAVYNRIIRDFNKGEPLALRIGTYSEAPAGSGLGSSSTLVVALIQAFAELLSLPLGEYDIARLAFEIERVELALQGGRQDQYAAAFGGFNFIEFFANERVIVNPLRIKERIIAEFEASLLLCFSGVSRQSAAIIKEQVSNVANKSASLDAMHDVKATSLAMKEALLKGDLYGVADILQQGWLSKRGIASAISNESIDKTMEAAYAAGALAGRFLALEVVAS